MINKINIKQKKLFAFLYATAYKLMLVVFLFILTTNLLKSQEQQIQGLEHVYISDGAFISVSSDTFIENSPELYTLEACKSSTPKEPKQASKSIQKENWSIKAQVKLRQVSRQQAYKNPSANIRYGNCASKSAYQSQQEEHNLSAEKEIKHHIKADLNPTFDLELKPKFYAINSISFQTTNKSKQLYFIHFTRPPPIFF